MEFIIDNLLKKNSASSLAQMASQQNAPTQVLSDKILERNGNLVITQATLAEMNAEIASSIIKSKFDTMMKIVENLKPIESETQEEFKRRKAKLLEKLQLLHKQIEEELDKEAWMKAYAELLHSDELLLNNIAIQQYI